MDIIKKLGMFSIAIFFLWLTIYIPSINELFLLDISNLSAGDRVLLQYSSLIAYTASMLMTAMIGGDE